MSAPIIVSAAAGATPLLFESSICIALLTVVPVGMWAKASISLLSELAREAGEAQPVGEAPKAAVPIKIQQDGEQKFFGGLNWRKGLPAFLAP